MTIEKWQAAGNTYLVVVAGQAAIPLSPSQARLLCDPRRGLGADGVLILDQMQPDHCRLRILNADGSEPEACGNGTRIAAAVTAAGRAGSVLVETIAGPRQCLVGDDGTVTARMADAVLESAAYQPTSERFPYPHRFVSIGNPHITIRVDDPAEFPLADAGPVLEHHPWLPQRANIEVWRDHERGVHARVWERGVGETAACGTGACAVAVAAVLDGSAHSPVAVQMPGGVLEVDVGADLELRLSGPVAPAARIRLSPHFAALLAIPTGSPTSRRIQP